MVWPGLRPVLIAIAWLIAGLPVICGEGIHQAFAQENLERSADKTLEGSHEWFLAPGRNIDRMIEQAQSLIADQRYREAVLLLQQILDKDEDFFLQPNSTRTIRRRVESMLLELPPVGQEVYELEFGKEAEYLLKLFEQSRDASKLSDIMRLYRATKAGQEASLIMLTRTFDRGDYLAAALLGTDLLERKTLPKDKRISVLWQTVFSWNGCKEQEKARALMDELRQMTPHDDFVEKSQFLSFQNQNEKTNVFTAEESSENAAESGHLISEWKMMRGTPDRNPAVGVLNSIMIDRKIPHLRRTDQVDLKEEVDYLLGQMEGISPRDPADRQLKASNPVLTKDVVVARTLSGLAGFELPSGKKTWETAVHDLEFDFVVKNSLYAPSAEDEYPETLKRYLVQKSLMNDATSSTLSSDGERVYVIQNGGILGVRPAPQLSDHPILTKSFNKLSAFELKSGKIVWQVGGSHTAMRLPLAGLFFLGPPVSLNGTLYVLGEMNQEIRLYALDPSSGHPLWSQPLALTGTPPEMDLERRMQGLSISVMDGILICPSGVGVVTAFNPITRQLLWNTYLFDITDPEAIPSHVNLRGTAGSNNPFLLYQQKLKQLIEPDWMDYPVICTSQEILVVSPEEDALFCLNVDGTVRWKMPRNNNLCVAGTYRDAVLVYSDQQFSAIDLATGKSAWPQPVHIPHPAGLGLRAGSHYYLPVDGHRIWTIDLDRGRLLVETGLPDEITTGHLMVHQDQLALYTPDQLWLFKSASGVKKVLAEEIAANPHDAGLWLKKGQFELQQHHDENGIAALKRAYELNPSGPAREILALSLLESLRTDFVKTQPDLELLKTLITDPQMKARLLVSTVNGLVSHEKINEAYKVLYQHLDDPSFADALITIENNHTVRIDCWIDKQLALIADHEGNNFRETMSGELVAWMRQRMEKGDSVDAAFRHFPMAMESLQKWTFSVLKDPQIDSAALECHLIQLRQSPNQEQAGWASVQYAKLMEHWKLVGWEERFEQLMNELGGRFANVPCGEGKTGKQWLAQWQKKYPTIFDHRDHQSPGKPLAEESLGETADASYRIQLTNRYPIRVLHGEDSAFQGWELSINHNRNAILIKDGFHQLQYQIRIPHNVQFQDPRNNYAMTQGHLATVVAGHTVTTFHLMSLANRPGDSLWSVTMEPAVNSIADVNRVFQEQPAVVSTISGATICSLSNQHLNCMDVLSGEVLWRQSHLGQGLVYPRVFTTSQHVILTGHSIAEKQVMGYVLDVIDGSIVKVLKEADAEFAMNSLQFGDEFWRFKGGPDSKLVVAKWNGDGSLNRMLEQGVSAKSIFKPSYQGRHAMLADADGVIRIYDLQTRRVVVDDDLSGRFSPYLIEQLEVHEDLKNIYLLLPTKDLDDLYVHGMTLSSLRFAGEIVCYDRGTGRLKWSKEFDAHALDQDQPRAWPFLVLSANVSRPDPQRPTQNQNFRRVTLIDKETGEVLEPERNDQGSHETLRNYAYRADTHEYEILFSRNHSLKVTYKKAEKKPVVEDVDPSRNF